MNAPPAARPHPWHRARSQRYAAWPFQTTPLSVLSFLHFLRGATFSAHAMHLAAAHASIGRPVATQRQPRRPSAPRCYPACCTVTASPLSTPGSLARVCALRTGCREVSVHHSTALAALEVFSSPIPTEFEESVLVLCFLLPLLSLLYTLTGMLLERLQEGQRRSFLALDLENGIGSITPEKLAERVGMYSDSQRKRDRMEEETIKQRASAAVRQIADGKA